MCQQLILKNEKKAVLNVLSCLFILSPKTLPSPPPPHLLSFSLRVNSQVVLETVKAFYSIKYLVRKFENEKKTEKIRWHYFHTEVFGCLLSTEKSLRLIILNSLCSENNFRDKKLLVSID